LFQKGHTHYNHDKCHADMLLARCECCININTS